MYLFATKARVRSIKNKNYQHIL